MFEESTQRWLFPLLILVVVVLGYGIGPTRLPLIGEEACRARIGIEMVESDDWVIATRQGVPILDRPPGHYWVLGATHRWVHPLDPMTLRLGMAAIVAATALLIWWYARAFLTPTAAFLAAVAYPTMGHVFDLGRLAETDGQFTLLVAASVMVWHYGYMKEWPVGWTWTLGAVVAGMAALTKGTQAPVAYFGTVYLFLLLRRDWRYLFHWSQFTGVAIFAALIATWQVPYWARTGWDGTRMAWLDPGGDRMSSEFMDLVVQLVKFPLVTLAATAPWSILSLGIFHPRFWRLDSRTRWAVVFNVIAVASVLVPVWINVGGKPRYIMPMYPMLAVICGAVAQQCLASDAARGLRRLWVGYYRVMTALLLLGLLGFLMVSAGGTEQLQELAQPWSLMTALLVIGIASAVILVRSSTDPHRGWVPTFTLAALLAIMFNGPIMNAQMFGTGDVGPDVSALRSSLPADVKLVSFGPLHTKFIYWYEDPIPVISAPLDEQSIPEGLDYFAMMVEGEEFELPFEWEMIARLNMDTRREPSVYVIIGRIGSS